MTSNSYIFYKKKFPFSPNFYFTPYVLLTLHPLPCFLLSPLSLSRFPLSSLLLLLPALYCVNCVESANTKKTGWRSGTSVLFWNLHWFGFGTELIINGPKHRTMEEDNGRIQWARITSSIQTLHQFNSISNSNWTMQPAVHIGYAAAAGKEEEEEEDSIV